MPDSSHDPTQFPSTIGLGGPAPEAGPLERLAQYRVTRPLGRGGMGVVYQAEDSQLHRMAALKVMRADYAADPEARARFMREARAAARLKHDHIVTIYQVGEANGIPFLAMELLAGKSLEEWLRPDRRATVVETLLIGKQVCRGLSAAHAAGLVHRDIKPANLWLEAPRGRVKILDFGLARNTSSDFPALTQDGSVLGTPAFMAPEQARGVAVDHRCDLFSLGCVLYRMLTGRLPFQGPTTFAVLTAIAADTPPAPAHIRPEIPQRLSDLVDQLLAKKPEDRPASAQAVLEELVAIEQRVKQPAAAVSLLPTPSLPLSLGVDTSSPPRKIAVRGAVAMPVNPKYAIAAGGVLLVFLIVAVAAMLLRDRPATTKSDRQKGEQGPRAVKLAAPSPAAPSPAAPSPAAPSTPPASYTAGPVVPLSELNTLDEDAYAWLTPDGLTMYFQRVDDDPAPENSGTFRAVRANPAAPFRIAQRVTPVRQGVLSHDELVAVGISKEGRLREVRRSSSTAFFRAGKAAMEDIDNPKSPWLSKDGLRLLFQRNDKVGDYPGKAPAGQMETEFVVCRRTSLDGTWSTPQRLRLENSRLYHDSLTWPSATDGPRILLFCVGGDRRPEIVFAKRIGGGEAYGDPERIMIEGKPLIGRAPRYVEATRELFFTHDASGSGTPNLDLWVVKDFVFHGTKDAADASFSGPPHMRGEFNGHAYHYFPESLPWTKARDRCRELGGYLVVIDSAAEDSFLCSLLEKAGGSTSWLGFTDEAAEGVWRTVQGRPLGYTNWGRQQPGNHGGKEHYALTYKPDGKPSAGWKWADLSDNDSRGFVCEWDHTGD